MAFGFVKRSLDNELGGTNDSHRLDWVNYNTQKTPKPISQLAPFWLARKVVHTQLSTVLWYIS